MHLTTTLLVKKEIDKYFKENIIKSICYSSWIYSVVHAQKPNGECYTMY